MGMCSLYSGENLSPAAQWLFQHLKKICLILLEDGFQFISEYGDSVVGLWFQKIKYLHTDIYVLSFVYGSYNTWMTGGWFVDLSSVTVSSVTD